MQDRRARHTAQWLAAPPVAASSPEASNLTRPSPTQSTLALDSNEHCQDLRHVHRQYAPVPPAAKSPGGAPAHACSAPRMLGTNSRKPCTAASKGGFAVGTSKGTSGACIGGVSGTSDESSVGGSSIRDMHGMHHTSTVRAPHPAAAFRRAPVSRQWRAPQRPTADHMHAHHGSSIAQHTQDTIASNGMAASTQHTAEDVAQLAAIAKERMSGKAAAPGGTTEAVQAELIADEVPGGVSRQAAGHHPMRHPVRWPRS